MQSQTVSIACESVVCAIKICRISTLCSGTSVVRKACTIYWQRSSETKLFARASQANASIFCLSSQFFTWPSEVLYLFAVVKATVLLIRFPSCIGAYSLAPSFSASRARFCYSLGTLEACGIVNFYEWSSNWLYPKVSLSVTLLSSLIKSRAYSSK